MGKITPCLITERLILEGVTEKDTGRIVAWRSNPEVYPFFLSPHPLSTAEHLDWFRNGYVQDNNRFDWIAEMKDGRKAVGLFGMKRENEASKEVEISYLLAPEAQGKGYASEAVKCIMGVAAKRWCCDSCVAAIHADNHASVEFVKRLGFTASDTEGVFVRYKREL